MSTSIQEEYNYENNYNKPGNISKIVFENKKLEKLITLCLKGNMISKLDNLDFYSCINLITLDLSKNNLKSFSSLFILPNLKMLNLSNNNIEMFDFSSSNLEIVDISDNKLQEVVINSKIKELNIRNNFVKFVES